METPGAWLGGVWGRACGHRERPGPDTREVSLAEALTLEAISVYGKQSTGEKYLINPNKGLA